MMNKKVTAQPESHPSSPLHRRTPKNEYPSGSKPFNVHHLPPVPEIPIPCLKPTPFNLSYCSGSPKKIKSKEPNRKFGTEKIIRAQRRWPSYINNSNMSFEINKHQDSSVIDKSIFDRSGFEEFRMGMDKFKQAIANQIKMYSENQRKVEKKAKAEKYKLKKQLGTNKISARDYANRVKAVEKWVTKKKETLKNTNNECGKQINQIIEKMHYSPGKDSIRDSRPNFSAYLNDISMDSIVNNSRLLPSDKKSSKKAMTSRIDPLCQIDNSLLHSAKKGNLENSTVLFNDPNSYLLTDRESKLHTKSNINYLNKESSVKKDKY